MRISDVDGNLPPKKRQRVRAVPSLPVRDGVSPSCVALPAGPWRTISDFFAQRFPLVTQESWLQRMHAGDVVDEHGVRVEPDRPYQHQLKIWYYRTLEDEAHIPFEETVLFQNELVVVADKPHFVPVVPTGRYLHESLLVRLKRKLGIDTLAPVHRIDRGTAGLVLFTVQPQTRDRYQALFRDREVSKRYEAIVHWREGLEVPEVYRSRMGDDASFLRSGESLGEPNSETGLKLMEVRGEFARLALSPVTGRKHQLRVHCASLGMPIVNDDYYPVLLPDGPDTFTRPLQLLAQHMAFRDPIDGREHRFESRRALHFADAAGAVAPT